MHWPVKLRESGKPLFFKLSFWDCGEAVLKKFDHILPVSSCPPPLVPGVGLGEGAPLHPGNRTG